MRLSLFVLGIIAATVCVETSAEAQNGAWCLYQDGYGDSSRKCRYATLQQCLADRLGVAPVDPVRTRPRRNHLRQLGSGGSKRLRLSFPAQEEPTAHGLR